MATSEGISSSIDIGFLELNDKSYITCFRHAPDFVIAVVETTLIGYLIYLISFPCIFNSVPSIYSIVTSVIISFLAVEL